MGHVVAPEVSDDLQQFNLYVDDELRIFVMKKLLLLCSLFILSSLQAMNQLQIQPLVKQMTEENRSVSPYDGIDKRLVRNTAICLTHPFSFFCVLLPRNGTREKLLLEYVTKRPLVLNGKDLTALDDGNQLREAFEKEQKQQIRRYLAELDEFNTSEDEAAGECCFYAAIADFFCGSKGALCCLCLEFPCPTMLCCLTGCACHKI